MLSTLLNRSLDIFANFESTVLLQLNSLGEGGEGGIGDVNFDMKTVCLIRLVLVH